MNGHRRFGSSVSGHRHCFGSPVSVHRPSGEPMSRPSCSHRHQRGIPHTVHQSETPRERTRTTGCDRRGLQPSLGHCLVGHHWGRCRLGEHSPRHTSHPGWGTCQGLHESPNVRWSSPPILHLLRGSSRALLKRSLSAASLYPRPSAAPQNLWAKLLTSVPC